MFSKWKPANLPQKMKSMNDEHNEKRSIDGMLEKRDFSTNLTGSITCCKVDLNKTLGGMKMMYVPFQLGTTTALLSGGYKRTSRVNGIAV